MSAKKEDCPLGFSLILMQYKKKITEHLKRDSFEKVLEDLADGIISLDVVINEYKKILSARTSPFINVLKFFHLLSRTRVLDKEASVIQLEVHSEDRPGMIYDLSRCFSERNINMSSFRAYAIPPKDALYRIEAEVKNFDELSELFDALLSLPNVNEVLRKN